MLARANAIQLWDPNAILNGGTAAKLSWWPELRWESATAIASRDSRRAVKGIHIRKGTVDPDLVWEHEGFRMVHPAWSALELIESEGGRAIDQVLRTRAATLGALHWALDHMQHRPGNEARRRMLLDSRDEPWSENERTAHMMLREAGIKGWCGNLRIVLPSGAVRFLDIGFKTQRIGVEIDSWEYHSSRDSFVDDRRKDVELMLAGWRILRFVPETLGEMVPALRALL